MEESVTSDSPSENVLISRIKNKLEYDHLIITNIMPVLKIQTFSRYVIMNRRKILRGTSGITELFCSLDSAFRQVSELLRRPGPAKDPTRDIKRLGNDLVREKIENIMISMLMTTNCVYYIISSAREQVISIKKYRQGHFILALDAIDGMENMGSLLPQGTCFGIYRPNQENENYKDLLYTCGYDSLIAAGYIIYGTATILIVAFRWEQNVFEFCYDTVLGEFVLINDNVRIPEEGAVYCIDNSNKQNWLNAHLASFMPETNVLIKHMGSFTANFHIILKEGGLLVDPPTVQFPEGQFQILSKLNPLALICSFAGGKFYGADFKSNILDVKPKCLNETSPCIMGSRKNIYFWNEFLENYLKKDEDDILEHEEKHDDSSS